MIEYSRFWFGVLIGIGIMFLSLAILFGLKVAYSQYNHTCIFTPENPMYGALCPFESMNNTVYGQDFDPCFVDNDVYKSICDQQNINNILNQLLERAKEWNSR